MERTMKRFLLKIIILFGVLSLTIPGWAQEKEWRALIDQTFNFQKQGRYPEAIKTAQQALTVAEATFGSEHPHVADSLNNLAFLYKYSGQFSEAESCYRQSLKMREKILGPGHPDVAASLHNLAFLYKDQKRFAEAQPLAQRALEMREKILGPNHPNVGASASVLAVVYHAQGRLADAEPLYKRSLEIAEKAYGPEHPVVATALKSLAVLYKDQGKMAEANLLERRAEDIRLKIEKPKSFVDAGKKGETIEEAVIIKAVSSREGLEMEYEYLSQKFGQRGKEWKLKRQSLIKKDDKKFDKMDLEFPNGANKTVYFDITSFFGK